jgi:CRISPR/Cas system-associated endoribonuclease Cas2
MKARLVNNHLHTPFLLTQKKTALAATLLWGRVFKSVFLGPLRDVEVEILYDNARYAITETCLALTIFREELNTRCVRNATTLDLTWV